MQLRPSLFGCLLATAPLFACNGILGLEHAELASTASAGRTGHSKGGQPAVGGMSAGTDPSGGAAGHPTTLNVSGNGAVDESGGSAGEASNPAVGALGGAAGITASSGGLNAGGSDAGGAGGQPDGSTGQAGCAAGADPGGSTCSSGQAPQHRCIEGWLTSCAADGTVASRNCTSQELCDEANGECDVCVAGATVCANDHQLAQCSSNGQVQTYADCAGTTPYCSGSICVACLAAAHCADPGECLDPTCTTEHTCAQKPSNAGTTCSLGTATGVCDGNGHCGSCRPGDLRCSATGIPELCVASDTEGGNWEAQSPCSGSASVVPLTCVEGRCEPPPSCRGMPEGHASQCGLAQNQHCCASPGVSSMGFIMGTNDATNPDVNARETPAHQVRVGALRLDTFEVTVGRFRRFIADYQGPPSVGTGADPYNPGPTGWKAEWDAVLPTKGPDAAAAILALIRADLTSSTWTAEPGLHEAFPINQVPWYLAFAFCAYDGGWLPSEAEWEAVASGAQPSVTKNYYPWGAQSDAPSSERATYVGSCPSLSCTPEIAFRRVGSAPLGVSAFGQYDMAGSVAEWMMDYSDDSYYEQFVATWCNYCVNTTVPLSGNRSTRGGHAMSSAASLRVTARTYAGAAIQSWHPGIGIRCARPR